MKAFKNSLSILFNLKETKQSKKENKIPWNKEILEKKIELLMRKQMQHYIISSDSEIEKKKTSQYQDQIAKS